MSLNSTPNQITVAFADVAQKVKSSYPASWQRLSQIYGDNENTIVKIFLEKPVAGFGDKSLRDVADEYGEEKVINYLNAVDAGIHH